MEITAYDIAQRFVGQKEITGEISNPHILAMLKLDSKWPEDDEVPWCSAFINYVAWILRLPRSKSLRARSWLLIGKPKRLTEARAAFDVVVFKRGDGDQPGPEFIAAPGHVGFFAGIEDQKVLVLGGNQKDSVNISRYPADRVLGVRSLS